jgi:hypothetical protein
MAADFSEPRLLSDAYGLKAMIRSFVLSGRNCFKWEVPGVLRAGPFYKPFAHIPG